GRPQVYKKSHGLLLFGKTSAQPGDCLPCTVAVTNRPTRGLACPLDIRGILLQLAQARTGVDDDGTEAFDKLLRNRLCHPARRCDLTVRTGLWPFLEFRQ